MGAGGDAGAGTGAVEQWIGSPLEGAAGQRGGSDPMGGAGQWIGSGGGSALGCGYGRGPMRSAGQAVATAGRSAGTAVAAATQVGAHYFVYY